MCTIEEKAMWDSRLIRKSEDSAWPQINIKKKSKQLGKKVKTLDQNLCADVFIIRFYYLIKVLLRSELLPLQLFFCIIYTDKPLRLHDLNKFSLNLVFKVVYRDKERRFRWFYSIKPCSLFFWKSCTKRGLVIISRQVCTKLENNDSSLTSF